MSGEPHGQNQTDRPLWPVLAGFAVSPENLERLHSSRKKAGNGQKRSRVPACVFDWRSLIYELERHPRSQTATLPKFLCSRPFDRAYGFVVSRLETPRALFFIMRAGNPPDAVPLIQDINHRVLDFAEGPNDLQQNHAIKRERAKKLGECCRLSSWIL